MGHLIKNSFYYDKQNGQKIELLEIEIDDQEVRDKIYEILKGKIPIEKAEDFDKRYKTQELPEPHTTKLVLHKAVLEKGHRKQYYSKSSENKTGSIIINFKNKFDASLFQKLLGINECIITENGELQFREFCKENYFRLESQHQGNSFEYKEGALEINHATVEGTPKKITIPESAGPGESNRPIFYFAGNDEIAIKFKFSNQNESTYCANFTGYLVNQYQNHIRAKIYADRKETLFLRIKDQNVSPKDPTENEMLQAINKVYEDILIHHEKMEKNKEKKIALLAEEVKKLPMQKMDRLDLIKLNDIFSKLDKVDGTEQPEKLKVKMKTKENFRHNLDYNKKPKQKAKSKKPGPSCTMKYMSPFESYMKKAAEAWEKGPQRG